MSSGPRIPHRARSDPPTSPQRRALSSRASDLAPTLLGAHLSSSSAAGRVTVRLTEVEAYEGTGDAASHAFRGRTERNSVMFGPAGHLYVYFVYGMHWCANLVCGIDGEASALLLRAGEVVEGVELARVRRPAARRDVELARGPARLARCLDLTRADNGADVLAVAARVQLQLDPRSGAAKSISCGPRVGVAAAGQVALRFWLSDEPSVSSYRPGGRRRAGPGPQRSHAHTESP